MKKIRLDWCMTHCEGKLLLRSDSLILERAPKRQINPDLIVSDVGQSQPGMK